MDDLHDRTSISLLQLFFELSQHFRGKLEAETCPQVAVYVMDGLYDASNVAQYKWIHYTSGCCGFFYIDV